MVISKQDHLTHENKTWHRKLEFLKQENALLKIRLSMITDSRDDRDFINVAEYFQNQFLLKDEVISGLEIDIQKHDNDINLNFNHQGSTHEILKKQEKLRKEINYFETDFSRVKNEFHQLITQYL